MNVWDNKAITKEQFTGSSTGVYFPAHITYYYLTICLMTMETIAFGVYFIFLNRRSIDNWVHNL